MQPVFAWQDVGLVRHMNFEEIIRVAQIRPRLTQADGSSKLVRAQTLSELYEIKTGGLLRQHCPEASTTYTGTSLRGRDATW